MQSNDLPVSPEIVHLPLDQLREAPWNPNQMTPSSLSKLERSVERFGLTGVLVVRPIGDDLYQVLSGNQRHQVLRKLKWKSAPCVIVEIGDSEARLLGQALNHVAGSDNLGLRAEVMREILKEKSHRGSSSPAARDLSRTGRTDNVEPGNPGRASPSMAAGAEGQTREVLGQAHPRSTGNGRESTEPAAPGGQG